MSLAEEVVVDDVGAGGVVYEMLTEEEACLYAILTDPSGLDLAEFTWTDERNPDGCWRAFPFQWAWWKDDSPQQVDQGARSIGKSESIMARVCVFPFVHPGNEMVITAPEAVHVDSITDRIEARLTGTRLFAEMLLGGRYGVNHRPFKAKFRNGAMVHSRLPQKSGIGVKGTHPTWLELDECLARGTLILTDRGMVPIEDVEVGDKVWTHRDRWRPVTATFERGVRDAVSVRGQGHPGLVCTPDHKVWARRIDRFKDPSKRWGPVHADHAEWVYAKDLTDCSWGSPLAVRGLDAPRVIDRSATNKNNAPTPITPAVLWLLGLYLAEGSTGKSSPQAVDVDRVTFSVHVDESGDVLDRIVAAGFRAHASAVANTDKALNIVVNHAPLARFLRDHCGRGAHAKEVPAWVLGLSSEERLAVLDGVVYGDGFLDPDSRYRAGRWKLSTASKKLAVSVRLLALSLGYSVSLYRNEARAKSAIIRGREIASGPWYQVVGNAAGQGFEDDGARWTRVRAVDDVSPVEMFDLEVADDHSFVADGLYVHNSQDYPDRGWKEIVETVNWSVAGSQWRCHGVSKGVRDQFYEMTQDDSEWRVHHYTAIHRPTWSELEREAKVAQYGGSIHDPDFRRNVYGVHGDQANNIFVLSRFMSCVDTDEGSHYNTEEYFFRRITAEMVDDQVHGRAAGTINESSDAHVRALIQMLDFPELHHRYEVFWVGMDVGITRDPSEILVFAEYTPSAEERRTQRKAGLAVPLDGGTRFKLVTRLSLLRLPTPLQAEVIMHLIDFYRPRSFAMDRTGNGLPVFQDLQKRALQSRLMVIDDSDDDLEALDETTAAQVRTARAKSRSRAGSALTVLKGYPFDGQIVVEIDEERAAALPGTPSPQEVADKAGIKRRVKDYATDTLRDLVDRQRLLLPYDVELINQWNAQTWAYAQSPVDAYGRRRMSFSSGTFHTLDGGRMAALGMYQQPIEALLAKPAPARKPVVPRFLG